MAARLYLMTTDPDYADARGDELKNQSDLAWDLDAITNRQQAIDFRLHFENRLCAYSSYVEKLSSNYSFVVPEEAHGSTTIFPGEHRLAASREGALPEGAETADPALPGQARPLPAGAGQG